MLKNNPKSSKGQLATIMNLILAVFVVGAIGVFAFELTRYFLAHDELKTNVEVAALSCQTTLASSGDPTSASNQANAEATALQLFKQNSILGQPMSGATMVNDPNALEPAPGNAQICFQFLDPLTRLPVNSSGAGVGAGVTSPSAAGTLIKAIGSYCYAPAFGQLIGLSGTQFTFQVSALSGVPKIDLMIVLDISGGMDDNTSVSFFQRYQGPSGTNWMILPNPITGGTAQGQLWSVWCPEQPGNPPVGANALPPCQYEKLDGSSCVTVHYSEGSMGGASTQLAGAGMGTPPGNACLSASNPPTGTSMLPLNYKYKHVAKKLKNFSRINKQIAETKHNKFTSSNTLKKKPLNIAKATDPGLLEICQKIAGKKATNNLINKTVTSQLDDKFSKVCFKPFVINGSAGSSSSTTAGGTSTGVIFTTTDPATNPPPASNYVAADTMKYIPLSVAPGSQAKTGPPVLPTIAGVGCSSGTSTIVVGAPAPKVFTGLFVNGVVGASKPNNPAINFNNAATAIEASLGDLESAQNAQQAGIDTTALGVTPQAGWYAFYYTAARPFLQPFMSCLNALIGFINEMAIISDIHYGFIAFNDNIGTDANTLSGAINNLSANYNFLTPNPGGTSSISSTYPLPNIKLSSTNSNQSAIINALPGLSVWGGRNVSQALQEAGNQLQNNGRPGANQAIILVTAGAPNGNDSAANAIAQASTIGQAGVPIFVICTSLSSSHDSANDDAYTDVGGSSSGVAGASGHGAKYYRIDYVDPTSTQNQLVTVFGNIARRLVSIVQAQ